VQLLINKTYSSEETQKGEIVDCYIYKDVVIDDKLVFEAGAKVYGEVMSVEDDNMLGKPGRLVLRLTHATAVDGQKVPILKDIFITGTDRTGRSYLLSFITLGFGILLHGTDAIIHSATIVDANIFSEVSIASKAFKADTKTDKNLEIKYGMPLKVKLLNNDSIEGFLYEKVGNINYIVSHGYLYNINNDSIKDIYDFKGNNITAKVKLTADIIASPENKYKHRDYPENIVRY
jgi:hypothetical protein